MKSSVTIIITNGYSVKMYPDLEVDKEQFSTPKTINAIQPGESEYAILIRSEDYLSKELSVEDIFNFGKAIKDLVYNNLKNVEFSVENEDQEHYDPHRLHALVDGIYYEDKRNDSKIDEIRDSLIKEMTDELDDDFDLDDTDDEEDIDLEDIDDEEEEDDNEIIDEGITSIEDFLRSTGIEKASKKKKNKRKKSSNILSKAKKKKKSIKKMNLIIVKKKKYIKRDKYILKKVIKEFFPGEGKFMKKFRKVILKRWIKMYSISKSTLKKLNKRKKKKSMSDIPDSIIRTFKNSTNDIWNNPNM